MHTTRTRPAPALLGLTAALLGLAGLAARPASAQTHLYTLNNTLADSNGGPALTADGGSLTASGYTFGANQGLTLINAVSATDYTIELNFSLRDVSSGNGYKKLLDFNDLSADSGLYLLSGHLNFFPTVTGPDVTQATQNLDVVLTRSGATGLVTGTLNGVSQFSFLDTSNIATFTGANSVMHFFEDDTATGTNEASGGAVTRIAITTPAPVPEASGAASLGLLLTLGVGGLVAASRRRKAAARH